MRANEGTLVTLDTGIRIPFRNIQSNTAFFVSRGAAGEGAVVNGHQISNGQLVAFQTVHGNHNLIYEIVASLSSSFFILSSCPISRNLYLNNSINASIYSSIVHLNDGFALLAIGVLNSVLHVLNSLINRNDVSQLEEGSLHYHINTSA